MWLAACRVYFRALVWRGVLFQRAGGVLWSVPGLLPGVACCLSVPILCPNLAWRAGLLTACRGVLLQLAGGVL